MLRRKNFIMLMSLIAILSIIMIPSFAASNNDSNINVILTEDEYNMIQERIADESKVRDYLSHDDLRTILDEMGFEDIELIPEENIVNKTESSKRGVIPDIGAILQGRYILQNDAAQFRIDPFATNASKTVISLKGVINGYCTIYPGQMVKNVSLDVYEPDMKPLHCRHFGKMAMPVYGKKAYYVTEIYANVVGGPPTFLQPAMWWNKFK